MTARPVPLTVHVAGIHPALVRERRWCNWRYDWQVHEGKTGRWTTIPYQPSGVHAKSNEPSTWCTLAQALAALGRFDGVMFALGDGYGGIEVDDYVGQCGQCGLPLRVCTRSHGKARARFYGCSGYHDRGRTVCANGADIPMADADAIVLEALLDDVLDQGVVRDAIEAALQELQGDAAPPREETVRRELARLQLERANLVRAIAAGGDLDDLVVALRERDQRRVTLENELTTFRSVTRVSQAEIGRVRREVSALADDWRQALIDGGEPARPIVSALLKGRVTFTHLGNREYELRGSGTYAGLLAKIFSAGGRPPSPIGARSASDQSTFSGRVTSPRGISVSHQPVFRGIWRSDRRAA